MFMFMFKIEKKFLFDTVGKLKMTPMSVAPENFKPSNKPHSSLTKQSPQFYISDIGSALHPHKLNKHARI